MDRQVLEALFDELEKSAARGDRKSLRPAFANDPNLKLIFKGSGDRERVWLGAKRGRNQAAAARALEKKSGGDIDDLEAPPNSKVMSYLRAANRVRKLSSWMDIGPDTSPNTAWRPREKRAYKLQGHTEVQGLRIAVENRKGSVRKGKDGDGKEWRTKMKHPYGYIVGTKGADGEPVDAYVGPDKEAPEAYVVHQRDKETGSYDEDKVMLGFRSKKEAKEAFLKHYDSPKFLGPISRVPLSRLIELVQAKKKLVKIS